MLELKHISKKFQERQVLDDISLCFPDSGFIGIQGESGGGKSTLLYIIGMLDHDYEGEILYDGEFIYDRRAFIQEHISYIMQNKDVIFSMTVKENILLATQVSQKPYSTIEFQKIVTQLELEDYLSSYPSQLSGGQLKRISIAKALLKKSSIILCDEPTGALHDQQAHEVMKSLKKLSKNALVIIVSHNPVLLESYCDSLLILKDGKLKGKMKKGQSIEKGYLKKRLYSLFHYSIRQMIYQKYKLIFLFLFQWIVIVSFFTIVTALNGVFDAIKESEQHAVLSQMIQVEKWDGTLFDDLLESPYLYDCSYEYQLDQLQLMNQNKGIHCISSFLPLQKSHIQLKQGRFPKQSNEIVVSAALYEKLEDKESLHGKFMDYSHDFYIVGVVCSDFFSLDEVYYDVSLKSSLSSLENRHVLVVEAKENQFHSLYQSLQTDYMIYSDVFERINNYQSLLKIARVIAYVFIGVSFMISMLLIGIVESILFYERRHDVAYLLSLGLEHSRLFLLSIVESLFLGLIMGTGGSAICFIFYDYMKNVYQLSLHYHFDLMLKTYFFNEYDLFVFICFSYMFMTVLGALKPILKMMKTNIIDTLREE